MLVVYGAKRLCVHTHHHCICRFGLTKEALKDVDELLEGVTKKVHRLTLSSQALAAATPPASLLGKCFIRLSLATGLQCLKKQHQLPETSLSCPPAEHDMNQACTLSVDLIKTQ